jgi:hypothetical protein
MTPETIALTLHAQEVMADSKRVCRETAANFRLTEELRKRAEQAMLGFEELLRAGSPSGPAN